MSEIRPPRRPKRTRFTVAQIEAGLRAGLGNCRSAAVWLEQQLNRACSRQLVESYVKRHPGLQKVRDEVGEEVLDIAESTVLQAMLNGDATMAWRLLETRGKHRGYTRRTELTGPQGNAIEVKDADAATRLIARLDQMAERLRTFEGGTLGNGAGGPGAAPVADPGTRH